MELLGTSTDAQGGLRIELGPLGSQGSNLIDRVPDGQSQAHTSRMSELSCTNLQSLIPFTSLSLPALSSTFFPSSSLKTFHQSESWSCHGYTEGEELMPMHLL